MPTDPKDIRALRRKAAKALSEAPEKPALMSGADLQKLVHELSVRQIELEAQNDELRGCQEQLKKTEATVRQIEERYKQLLDSVTDYVYTVQVRDGRPVATIHGPGCAAVTGYSPEEYQADPYLWYRMVHEEDRDAVNEQAARMLSEGFASPLEHRIIHRDGSIRWVRNTPVPHYDGQRQLIAYDGLIADITNRKQIEEELKNSEERFRLTLEATRIGIWDWDIKNDRWYGSPTYFTMLGQAAESRPLDRNVWLKRVHPEDRAYVNEKIQNAMAGNFEEYRYEARVRHADGAYRWEHVLGFGIERDEAGRVTRMLGITMDITDRKRAEEELGTSRLHLAEAAEIAKIAYWEFDEAADEYIFNDAFYALYATTAEREGGYRMTWDEFPKRFVHPEDVKELDRKIDKFGAAQGASSRGT